MTYADRSSRAGVPIEFHMYPRTYHGFYQATNAHARIVLCPNRERHLAKRERWLTR